LQNHLFNPILLGVNIDHIASLRQSRLTQYPDPIQAAYICEQAGADSITVHLREDRRHIQERDVELLMQTLETRMNLEMAVTDEMLSIAESIKPADCCLVPEKREELTTEGGLDVLTNLSRLKEACQRLAEANIKVSLFIDAVEDQIAAAVEAGAPAIEIHTGHYADAKDKQTQQLAYDKIVEAVEFGNQSGLQVNAGHGLHYHNVRDIAAIDGIRELNIGHAIIARAVFTGLDAAVREMRELMQEGKARSTQ
jgi:pyridoxine 5-phosphate synthase